MLFAASPVLSIPGVLFMKKLLALLLAISLLVSCLGGCNKEPEITKYTAYEFAYFDTVSVIMGYAGSQEEFDSVCEEIKVLLNEYHQLYTIYNFYESVNNMVTINALKDGEHQVIEVDRKIIDLLLYAKEMYIQLFPNFRVQPDCK